MLSCSQAEVKGWVSEETALCWAAAGVIHLDVRKLNNFRVKQE
jgi:hypothetical protein